MQEEWKDIPGYCGRYQASTLGRIRSVDWKDKMRNRWGQIINRHKKGRILSLRLHTGGYFNVYLAGGKYAFVHRLVAMTFQIQIPGTEVNHINGNKKDNRPENLEWITRKENIHHSERTGLAKKGHERQAISIKRTWAIKRGLLVP